MVVQGAKQGSDWGDWFGVEVDVRRDGRKRALQTPIYPSRQQS